MKIAFYGSSLLSSYWNGAATYYRGLIRALAHRGHAVTFYEPDAFERHAHRDIDPPSWCRVVIYVPDDRGIAEVSAEANTADVVIKASGVGVRDDDLLETVMAAARRGALRIFWDVDAPATLAEIGDAPEHPIRLALPRLDGVFTYGGGPGIEASYRALGARACSAIYNALDRETHFPAPADPRFTADLAFLGNRLPDREARVGQFFLDPARRLPDSSFLLGGAGWEDANLPPNVRRLGHVSTRDHNAWNASPRAVLNISRESMAARGFSPATRIFEAAGAAACIITDVWVGIELFLAPGREVLVARDGLDVAEALASLDPSRARAIGAAARARVLAEHTYDRRAAQVEKCLAMLVAARAAGAAA